MDNVMTTRLSSKGQIVLPEALRTEFGWGWNGLYCYDM